MGLSTVLQVLRILQKSSGHFGHWVTTGSVVMQLQGHSPCGICLMHEHFMQSKVGNKNIVGYLRSGVSSARSTSHLCLCCPVVCHLTVEQLIVFYTSGLIP